MPRRLCLLVAVAAAACGPRLPPGWDVEAARAFQRETDAEMGEATSPLSAVDAHYFGPDAPAKLGVVDGAVVAGVTDPAFEFAIQGGSIICRVGCGPAPARLDHGAQQPMDGFVLVVSQQPGGGGQPGGRVAVHDPRAPHMTDYQGLVWFEPKAEYIAAARLEPAGGTDVIELATTRGASKPFVLAGTLAFELRGRTARLAAYRGTTAAPGTPLLVPFTDPTNGESTYPVGRYLEVDAGAKGGIAVDFNRATNPWCAYSPHYNCPVPPAQNRLEVPVEAGERVYAKH